MPRPAAEVVVDPAHGGLEVGAEVCGGGVEDVNAVALELVALCGRQATHDDIAILIADVASERGGARGSYLGIELEANLAKGGRAHRTAGGFCRAGSRDRK